jgi:ABC-type glutathione transport system ATPase component
MTLQESLEKKPALSWSQISATITSNSYQALRAEPISLLTDVSGIAQAGEILAIMGTSGTG